MSRFDGLRSFFGRREQKSKDIPFGNIDFSLGGGGNINYFAEDTLVTKESDGIEVNSQANAVGECKAAEFGNFAGFMNFAVRFNPNVLLKNTKFDSLLNNLGLCVAFVLKSEVINVKVLNDQLEVVDSTVFSSLRYKLNLMLTWVLLQSHNLTAGVGIDLLAFNKIGKSRMAKLGRFLVVSITGIVKNLRFINFGFGLEFMDGAILGKLIFSLIKHRRFLVV